MPIFGGAYFHLTPADLHNDVTYKAGVKVQQLAIENVWEIPNAC